MKKTCIITGAGNGIGRETAIVLSKSKEFESLILIGRNVDNLMETKRRMNSLDKDIELIEYDLSQLDGIPSMIDNIYKKHGRIDCLLNIAGYTEPSSLLSTTTENFITTYSVNVFSVFLLIKECVKYMKAQNGAKILNVASTAGITPRPGWLSYASSKAAVISMSDTLSAELAEYKILVYCISPGRCATKLRKRLAPDEDQTKIMQPEEVARIITQLISENEMCLDGQNIIIRKQSNLS